MDTHGFSLLYAAAALLLTACQHDFHERVAGDYGYLSPELLWEDATDVGTAIDHLQFVVNGQGMEAVNRSFDSKPDGAVNEKTAPRQSSSWCEPLTPGVYSYFVAANMTASEGYVLKEQPATDTLEPQVSVSLSNPAASPPQSWFGVGHATATLGVLTVVRCPLQRLLSVLMVKVYGVPQGTSIRLSVLRVATSVNLTATDANGRYGVPSAETQTVDFGPLQTEGSAYIAAERTLLPTATGYERSRVVLDATEPTGIVRQFIADVPRMLSGGRYVLELSYSDLPPNDFPVTVSINNWGAGEVSVGKAE